MIQKARCSRLYGNPRSFGLMGNVGAAVTYSDGWVIRMDKYASDLMPSGNCSVPKFGGSGSLSFSGGGDCISNNKTL